MKWVIIGKDGCVWCEKTKELLHTENVEFTYIEAHNELRSFLINSNLLTVPQVYADGQRIGGHEAVVEWFIRNGNSGHA